MRNTPYMDAVRQLFEELGISLEEFGAQPRSVTAFLFGGAAVHYHTQHRVSSDVDAEIIPTGFNPSDLKIFLKNAPVVDYEDTGDGGLRMVELDGNFTPTLGPLHEDYQASAHLTEWSPDGVIQIYVVSPEDLGVSKLGRLSEVDVEDILVLLECKCMAWDSFERRATEAIQYAVGNHAILTGHLDYVRRKAESKGLLP